MERRFEEFSKYVWELGQEAKQKVPIVYGGDIFDKWNSPVELVNFAIRRLPPGYSIPGQHDLPNHSLELMHKSAYWTLVQAGVLNDISDVEYFAHSEKLVLHPFPWGKRVETPAHIIREHYPDAVHLAVCHAYIWHQKSHAYNGAPEEQQLRGYEKALQYYDAAVFGDNHKGFLAQTRFGTQVLNNGGLFSIRSDERTYQPGYGILWDDGTITRRFFDCDKDEWHDESEVSGLENIGEEALEFLEELSKLGDKAIDFAAVLRKKAGDIGKESVKKLLLRALEE